MSEKALYIGVGALVGAGLMHLYRQSASKSTVSHLTPSVIDSPVEVVNIDGKLCIYEHAGNASNGEGSVSIAYVKVTEAIQEAVQIPKFDEYVHILSGVMVVYVGEGISEKPITLTASAGQTLHLPRGHKYRYTFPGPCNYLPVCLPAFSPDLAGRIE